jgi:hypothetical protein
MCEDLYVSNRHIPCLTSHIRVSGLDVRGSHCVLGSHMAWFVMLRARCVKTLVGAEMRSEISSWWLCDIDAAEV